MTHAEFYRMKNYTTKRVKRYYCNFCRKSYATKIGIKNHMHHCWYNPFNRTCKTCKNYVGKQKCTLEKQPYWQWYGNATDVNINCEKWEERK